MKKLIVRLVIAGVVVLVLAVVALGFFLDRLIKAGVETIGSRVTGVDVRVQSVGLSFLSGSGAIKGLVVGNPPGCKTPWAISVGAASLSLEPRSLLSDKIVIKSISLDQPEIAFETDLRSNNLGKILANVRAATAGGQAQPAKPANPAEPAQPASAKPAKKLELDDFTIKGAKVHLSVTSLAGQSATVTLPEIQIRDLGRGPEGITAGELTQRILERVEQETSKATASTMTDMSKGALYMAKDLGKGGTNSAQAITKGLGNFLKKK